MKSLNTFYQSYVGGSAGMGLTWALGWGLCVGGIFEAFIDPYGELLDMWPHAMAVPGFLGGVIFYTVLRIAEGRHRLDKLPLARTSGWGAVSGLLVGLLAVATGYLGSLFPNPWVHGEVIISLMILVGGIAAVVSAKLFEYAMRERQKEHQPTN